MHNYKELRVWKEARALVKIVYCLTEQFPKHELFGLSSRMRRAVISIPSNIAEGAGRTSEVDFSRFLDIANGSAFELEAQLYLASDIEFIEEKKLQDILPLVEDIQKMLHSLKKTIIRLR